MTIGIAILGAGIFATEEHLPAVQACDILSLKAVYSRSESSSTSLAKTANVDAYYDSSSSKTLEDLLKRNDIQAVVIGLPINVQPEVIKKALAAGKHVLSEKPIAKDLKTAQELIDYYRKGQYKGIWSVGENFRFLEVTQYGFEQAQKIGGKVTTFSMKLYGFIDESDKFYQTAWRQVPEYQGGFLLDGGIHFVAGLRYLLQACNEQITDVAAFTSLLQKKLAPVDTIHATMKITNGSNGTFSVSFGAEFKSGFEIEVVTENGAVTVEPTKVTVTTKKDGKKDSVAKEFPFGAGVKQEMVAFAKAIEAGKADPNQTPEQALIDLTVLQSLLESGEQGGKVLRVV